MTEKRILVIAGEPSKLEVIRKALLLLYDGVDVQIICDDEEKAEEAMFLLRRTAERLDLEFERRTEHLLVHGEGVLRPLGIFHDEILARDEVPRLLAESIRRIPDPKDECFIPVFRVGWFQTDASDIAARHSRNTSNWRRNGKPRRRCQPLPGSL